MFHFVKLHVRGVARSADFPLSRPVLDCPDESVAAPRNRLYETRAFGRIAEGVTELLDRCIQTIVEVHEGVARPQLLFQFLARENLPRLFQQSAQNLKRLFLKFDRFTILAQFTRMEVHLEVIEAQNRTRLRACSQGSPGGQLEV